MTEFAYEKKKLKESKVRAASTILRYILILIYYYILEDRGRTP